LASCGGRSDLDDVAPPAALRDASLDATVVPSPIEAGDALTTTDVTLEAEAAPGDAPSDAVPADDAAAPPPCPARIRRSSPDDGACAGGSVTFHLDAPPDWYIDGNDNEPTMQGDWLTIFSPSGEQLPLFAGYSGQIDCTTCQPAYGYGFGGWSGQIGDAGADQTWDGVYFEPGQCWSDAGFLGPWPPGLGACSTRRCAAPGTYDAVFCAHPASSNGQRNADASCTTVPFDYPAAAVCGTLPDRDRDRDRDL
jgi:hypothetical protein